MTIRSFTAPLVVGLASLVDEDLARAHPFTGDDLHLNMQDAPCNYAEGNTFVGGAPPSKD